jgi:hypothetical protein
VSQIVHDAVAADELRLPLDVSPEELVFGLWSMTFGAYSMLATNPNLPNLGIVRGYEAVRAHLRHMLDGYQWRPLTDQHDYDAVVDRILHDHFPEESLQLSEPAQTPAGIGDGGS